MPIAKKLKTSDLKAFDLAAAGHDGVLSDESGALVIKPCTAREVLFYESAAAHATFARWMPTFFGTLQLHDDLQHETTTPTTDLKLHDRHSSIVLQNLTHNFLHACVLDIKLGAQLWDNDASQEKRDRLDAVSDATTSRSLGMRLAGMKVWKGHAQGGYKVYDKHYGRTFNANTVVEAVKEYLDSELNSEQRRVLANRWVAKILDIVNVLEHQESRMYSASLLFVYEGDRTALEEALEEEKTRIPKTQEELDDEDDEGDSIKKVEVLKLIDFAHANWTPGKGPDENVLQGLRSTIKLLKQVVAE